MPTTIRDLWIGTEQRPSELRDGANTTPPQHKGWFPYDRPTLARATIVTVAAAFLRTYVLTDKRAALLDWGNALLFPLLLNIDPITFELWKVSGIDLTQAGAGGADFNVALLLAGALGALSMRDVLYSMTDVAKYALAVGSFNVMAREVTERLMEHDNAFTANL